MVGATALIACAHLGRAPPNNPTADLADPTQITRGFHTTSPPTTQEKKCKEVASMKN